MAPKAKDKDKVVSAKGDEAEDMVLKYLKKVNRPYASTDISANLKQAVSKAAAQKALLSLSDKGLLTKKDYGKQTVFVYPQEAAGDSAESSLADLDAELQALVEPLEEAKKRASKLQTEVNALKSTPTTDDLEIEIEELNKTNATHLSHLEPLRAGAQPISPEDLKAADAIWTKERAEWVKRRKTFNG
ncbi:Tat binding protein 1-interacting [Mrakia frigida]|uniref:Hop2p n=1 Tax=Mrakia frigida TaxID=29902 RepID=UPI003FCC1F80